MDNGNGLPNWGSCYPQIKENNLGLQLRSTAERDNTKQFLYGRNSAPMMVNSNAYHHHHHRREYGLSESQLPTEFGWFNHREKFLQMLPPRTPSYISETSGNHLAMQMLQQSDALKDESLAQMEEIPKKGNGPSKKRIGGHSQKPPKSKKSKRDVQKDGSNPSVQRARPMRKSVGVVIEGIDMDLSGLPIPVCSCTGTPQQCYRWGCGGWQSACCTNSISMYPLPTSNKRRGARIAGRKMSQGAFKKVLEKLAAEGYNLSNQIDLRSHWAKHGTNKFVTIR